MPRADGLTAQSRRLLAVLREHDKWMTHQDLTEALHYSELSSYLVRLLQNMAWKDLIEMRLGLTGKQGPTPYEYRAIPMMPPDDKRTLQERKLYTALQECSNWVNRAELIQAIGKKQLGHSNKRLLQEMFAKGLIQIHRYHTVTNVLVYEYRVKP
jgi:hypothetical protein